MARRLAWPSSYGANRVRNSARLAEYSSGDCSAWTTSSVLRQPCCHEDAAGREVDGGLSTGSTYLYAP